MYNINWTKFVEERLPSPVRKVTMRAWVQALLTPVKTIHTAFLIFKDTQERDLKITPQVRILRYWLNEFFDQSERRFDIEDFTQDQPLWINPESENNPIWLPTFLRSSSYEFTVVCPCELQDQIVDITAFMEKYKLAGKRYKLLFKNPDGSICSTIGTQLLPGIGTNYP